jgi:hypothetical protein
MIKKIVNICLSKIGYTVNKLPSAHSDKNDLSRIKTYAENHNEIKLHIGCGARVLKNWINIDLSYTHYGPYLQYYTDKHYPSEIRGDRDDLYIINIINDGLPFVDESVDIIFHEDFFEHLTQKEQIVFLVESLRVLKKGGVHRINTPNLSASMRDNSTFRKGREGVFTGEWDWWHHHNVINPTILEEMIKIVGYSSIIFNSKDHSIIADKLPSEYRPDEKDRPATDSNVFADLIK